MAWARTLLFLLSLLFATLSRVGAAEAKSFVDVDDQTVILGKPGQVTVLIYCTESTQKETRKHAESMDAFKGRPDFRYVVLLDLRNSFAALAMGYVKRRVQADLNKEAERLRPFYKKNGNKNNPRDDLSVILDFTGDACKKLGWGIQGKTARIVIYDKSGKAWKEWEHLKDEKTLPRAVQQALSK